MDDLEQVVGNAEDEFAENIQVIRDRELLYSGKSLLAVFGPMVVEICSSGKTYQV